MIKSQKIIKEKVYISGQLCIINYREVKFLTEEIMENVFLVMYSDEDEPQETCFGIFSRLELAESAVLDEINVQYDFDPRNIKDDDGYSVTRTEGQPKLVLIDVYEEVVNNSYHIASYMIYEKKVD